MSTPSSLISRTCQKMKDHQVGINLENEAEVEIKCFQQSSLINLTNQTALVNGFSRNSALLIV